MIVADSREPKGHPFQTEELPCGDYVITDDDGGGIIVERKEWTDFVSSYRSGNLFLQLGRCIDQDGYEVVLMIEGKRGAAIKYANAKHYELRRVLSSIVTKMPIKLAYTRNLNESFDFVKDIDSWIGSESGTHTIREAEKVPDELRPRYIVEGLPNVGPTNAERLIEHFGSVRAVFTATEEELQEVDGIGPKTAEGIVEAIA